MTLTSTRMTYIANKSPLHGKSLLGKGKTNELSAEPGHWKSHLIDFTVSSARCSFSHILCKGRGKLLRALTPSLLWGTCANSGKLLSPTFCLLFRILSTEMLLTNILISFSVKSEMVQLRLVKISYTYRPPLLRVFHMKTVLKRVHILKLYIKQALDMMLKTHGLSLSLISGVTTEPDGLIQGIYKITVSRG